MSSEPLFQEFKDHMLCPCPPVVDKEFAWALLNGVIELAANPPIPAIFVLDFKGVLSVDQAFFREVFQVWEILRKWNCSLVSINLSRLIMQQVVNAGFDNVLSPKKSLEHAREVLDFSAARTEILKNFVTPFINATKYTLEIQANIKARPDKPYLKDGQGPSDICIAGIIAIKSKAFSGAVTLLFTEQVFFQLCSGLMGEPVTSLSGESRDAAGEILNIIFGQATAELAEKQYQIENAIPSIIMGEQLKVIAMSKGQSVILPFKTDVGPFFLEICLDPPNASARAI